MNENTVWHTEIIFNGRGRAIPYDSALVHRILTSSTGDPKSLWCSPRPSVLLVQTQRPLLSETFRREAKSIRQAKGTVYFESGTRVEISGVVNATRCVKYRRIPIKEEEHPAWLKKHLQGCQAEIDALEDMSPVQGNHDSQRITISRMAFHGFATVTDSEKFADTLKSGIGRGKRFGAGLVMARRAT